MNQAPQVYQFDHVALTALLAKIEDNEHPVDEALAMGEQKHIDALYRALGGSMDAAKYLHEELLEFWYDYTIKCARTGPKTGVSSVKIQHFGMRTKKSAEDLAPARAWVAALIKVLIAIAKYGNGRPNAFQGNEALSAM